MSDIVHTEDMPTITLTQGQRIRYARDASGLEQADIAAACHVAKSAVSAWENDVNSKGAPWASLRIIAELTGFPVEFFEPRHLEFAPITAPDEETITGRYLRPRPYDLPLFVLDAAA